MDVNKSTKNKTNVLLGFRITNWILSAIVLAKQCFEQAKYYAAQISKFGSY